MHLLSILLDHTVLSTVVLRMFQLFRCNIIVDILLLFVFGCPKLCNNLLAQPAHAAGITLSLELV